MPESPTTPIFIGGLYKSGTSLLRAMLGQHANIAAGLETNWFEVDWAAGLGRGGEPLADYVGRCGGFFGLEPGQAADLARASADVVAFVNGLLGGHAARLGKRRWAEKTPGNILHVGRIREAWPGARILHIVRDPRDVFASLRQAGKWDSIAEFSERWCAFLGAAAALTGSDLLELRYEDLVADPKATMAWVLEHLDEPWQPEVARFAGQAEDYERVLAATGKASTTLERLGEPLSERRVGIWRGLIAADELAGLRAAAATHGLGGLYDRIVSQTPDG
ncbi:MAG TPA: sulfotransferase [Alphaproteobacteria bacterium]|jgi:hypothetical protein|nr:sulfotransferase [Alphaproteobacteria bacterium]MDP7164150.1 sulfotransferase [Alphaproteobacteria bacterium]MDP7427757.1 sulfotransferase [Alphaproteobacteria bacterium]HJM49620.1 sulfotransferase [Alphaproteobacteria bacterium]